MLKKFFHTVSTGFKDENFMELIHWIENFVSKVLSLALIAVILVSLIDLVRVLSVDLLHSEPVGFFNTTLIDLFGLFLNILIALELLENVTAYLKKHIVQVELVVVTALIAVSRKIIIFDPNKYAKIDLIALAGASLALAISYWLIKTMNEELARKQKKEELALRQKKAELARRKKQQEASQSSVAQTERSRDSSIE
jgi:uncharacterized membrane protein (DUF373 family)